MHLLLSLLMLCAIALLIGAAVLWRRGDRRKAALMAATALIALGNLAILLAPIDGGASPASRLTGPG